MHTLSKRSPSSMGRRSLSLLLPIIMTLSLAVVVLVSRPDETHARPDDARAVATVPAPSPPASDYEIGAYFWPLYKQGTHFGWDLITPYEAERKPLGVGWYDEDSPEAWSWFNRWALNYGLKFWVIGWFRDRNGPINNDTEGRHALDAFKASQFSDQMKFAVDIHNWVDADAAEVENNIYPHLKTQFEDPRYLVKDNKPILYLIDSGVTETSFAMDKLRQLAIADGWSGVTILERFGQAGSDGQVVYNDMIDGGCCSPFYAMPVVSQGWSPEPWGGGFSSQGFRTVSQFQTKLQEAKAVMDAKPAGSLGRTMALVGAWNEFGEGHFVAPASLAGFGYLNAVRQTFTSGGSLPSDTLPASPIQTRFDNLGAHWKLDESSGTVVNDSSVFGHDATNVGATWDPGGGVLGGALDFDGVNDYVQLEPAGTDSESFMHEKIGTRRVSLRFKADTTAGTQVLYDEGGTDNGLAIRINNGNLQAAGADTIDGSRVLSTGFTDTTSWHKVDVMYSWVQWTGAEFVHGRRQLFLDGETVAFEDNNKIPGPHLSEAALGARWGGDAFGTVGDGGYFNGKIDDVQVSFRPIPPTPEAPIGSGEAGRWALDEGAGTTAEDSTSNNNDGALVGGPAWVAGVAGNAVDLDGTDDYVSVADAAVLDGMSQLTVSTWVNLDTLPTATKNYIVVGKDLAYRLIVYDSGAGHFVAATTNNAWYDTGTVAEFTTPLSLSGWHHLVGVYDGSTVRIYVDGELAGTGPAAISGNIVSNNEALQFGGVGIGASSLIHTDGKIDEVRVYRRALNATEVQTLYSCVTCQP